MIPVTPETDPEAMIPVEPETDSAREPQLGREGSEDMTDARGVPEMRKIKDIKGDLQTFTGKITFPFVP